MQRRRVPAAARARIARATAAALLAGAVSAYAAVEFRHIVFDTPLDVPEPGADATEAVKQFHQTGKDPYVGDAQAAAEGRKLFQQWCASCHGPKGTGGMGPSLVDDQAQYPRTETHQGLFETIYGGALGAMQPFGQRIAQDDILKIIAYIEQLRSER